jgi:integrase
MSGSMRQRSAGSWELRVYVGLDPGTGRRRYRSKTVRGNRADAERELVDFADRVGHGLGVGGRATVGELLDRWFALASLSWAPTTVRQTRSIVDRHLRPHIGRVPVGELTTADIDGLYVMLLTGSDGEKGLSGGTVQRVHVVLRSALAQAMRWEWIWDNPAAHAAKIVAPNREPDPPSVEELVALLDYLEARDPALHAFVAVAATTGARRAQLLGLRWRNVDLDAARVSFSAGWVEGPNGPVLAHTKTRRHHVVELDIHMVEVLAAHRDRCGDVGRDGFVFASPADAMAAWKPNWVTKAFGRAVRGAGLGSFRLHDLRHFMATEMLELGVPVATVSGRLDHRRTSTTLNYYAHATPRGDRAAAETLRQVLDHARLQTRTMHKR